MNGLFILAKKVINVKSIFNVSFVVDVFITKIDVTNMNKFVVSQNGMTDTISISQFCDKSFAEKQLLKSHVKSHSNAYFVVKVLNSVVIIDKLDSFSTPF